MPLSLLPKPAIYLVAFFAFVGFADAAYLTADKFFVLPLPCSLTGGCDIVLSSQYSMIGPVPLAAFGAAYYLLALFLAVYLYTSLQPKLSIARGLWILSGLGVLASAYFVYLQVSVLEAICAYCIASAMTSLLLFASSSVLVFQMSKRAKNPESPSSAT